MKVRVKDSVATKDHYGNKIIDFAGFTGELMSDRTVVFDEKSKRKIPKGWIKQGELEGYDPYSYVFFMDDLEIVEEGEK